MDGMTDDTISRQATITEIMADIEDRSLHDDPNTSEDYAEGYDEGIRNAAAIVLQVPPSESELEQKIKQIGYTGKEGIVYIGGRKFAVREMPQ